MQDKLLELQQLFIVEAAKYNVSPIDDRMAERFSATIAGRPELHWWSTATRSPRDASTGFIMVDGETMDIGIDMAQPVTDDYPDGPENAFTRSIKWVEIDIEDEDVAHSEDPEQTYHQILARR